MPDLFDKAEVPLHEQIACAQREVKLRRRVYVRFVASGKMTQPAAEREIERPVGPTEATS